MTTIRARLTVWYTVAMAVVMLAFGTALVIERRHPGYAELDERLALEADFALGWLTEQSRVLGGDITVVDSVQDRRTLGWFRRPVLAPDVRSYLEAMRDPLLVVDSLGNQLYASQEARLLNYESFESLRALLKPRPTARVTGTTTLDPTLGVYRYLATPVPTAASGIGGILIATPTRTAPVEPRQLIRSMLVIAPIILMASVGIGYWLAGRSLRPVQDMMDELEAIQDGRSLHRRLMVPRSGDELARLAMKVNGMIARLEQSFSGLRRFTADASHELKTPLMVIRAGVERALTNPKAPAENMETLDETLNQINLMSELVETLLTLARADEGRATLAVEPKDIRPLVAEAAETAGILGEAADISVRVNLPQGPVVLPVDSGRIRQLLLNLVTNAIKYTQARGTVALELVDSGPSVTITVSDTGIGIAAGDLPHVFDRFWRADLARTRTGDRSGFGLGLAISRWIAEAHGGSIAVQSRPGRGSTFTVTLPHRKAPEKQPNSDPSLSR
jgi:two-component system OmpR family sensor kinase